MHAVNVFLNWVLILGNLGAPALGVYGTDLATTLSICLGQMIYVYFGLKYACGEGFLRLLLGLAILKAQLKVSLSARSSSAGSAPRNWPRSTC